MPGHPVLEENILFPMALDTLTEDEWLEIAKASREIGYSLITPEVEWEPVRADIAEKAQKRELSHRPITVMLNLTQDTLPRMK